MFEFLFNYSSEVYERGRFIFANTWPIWILIGAFSVLSLVIVFFLYKNRRQLQLYQLAVIGLLQMAMLALALLLVWQPSLLLEKLRSGDNVIAMMLDTSQSMAYGAGSQTRIQQARAIAAGEPVTKLRDEYKIKDFTFAGDAEEVQNFDKLPAPGSETNLGTSILKVLRQASTTSLGAIIILSDGADNSGAIDQNQLAEISSYGVPIHTIGIGREKIPEDVELSEVMLPEKALPDSSLSARVSIRHDGGGSVRVKVYDGDDFLAAKEVNLDADESVTTAWLDFKVNGTGDRDLHFSVDPIANERDLQNNTRTRVIDIPENSYRILYIEGEPRWEYKFMRRALDGDKSVQLVSMLRVSTNKFYRQGIDTPDELKDGFPTDREALYAYNALIIGSIEAPIFTSEQQQLIHDFVSQRGGSLLMLAGPNGLGDGHWGNTVVGDVLPAALPDTGKTFIRSRTPVDLTPVGRQSSILKFSDDSKENDTLWSELPDLADYQTLGALRPAAITLLNTTVDRKQQPILVTQSYGRGHSYILATGGTWRWQMLLPVKDLRHETFWRQLIRGMVAGSPKHFELSTTVTGNKLGIQADIRDKKFEPVTDISVTAVLSQDGAEPVTLDLQPSPDQAGVYQAEYHSQKPGLISIEAISRKGDKPLDNTRTSVFNDTGNAENFSLRQNRELLQRLADISGGRYWSPDQLGNLPDAIQLSHAGITEQDIRPLWDAPVVFLLLILLKTIEWLLRRRWRTI